MSDGTIIRTRTCTGPQDWLLDFHYTLEVVISNSERKPLADLTDDEVEAMVHRAVVRACNQETK